MWVTHKPPRRLNENLVWYVLYLSFARRQHKVWFKNLWNGLCQWNCMILYLFCSSPEPQGVGTQKIVLLNMPFMWVTNTQIFVEFRKSWLKIEVLCIFVLKVWTLLDSSPSNGTLFFGNNIKSKMGILNLIWKIYFNQKTLTKNIFLKLVYVFINAGIGWNFNILNVLCQITFPSCTLSDMDQWLLVKYKTMYILI